MSFLQPSNSSPSSKMIYRPEYLKTLKRLLLSPTNKIINNKNSLTNNEKNQTNGPSQRRIWAVIIPTSDPHNSEYVADKYKYRAALTNFWGSAGTAVVTAPISSLNDDKSESVDIDNDEESKMNECEALLWTDGRYHVEASKSISQPPWKLMKDGLGGVPTMEEWIAEKYSMMMRKKAKKREETGVKHQEGKKEDETTSSIKPDSSVLPVHTSVATINYSNDNSGNKTCKTSGLCPGNNYVGIDPFLITVNGWSRFTNSNILLKPSYLVKEAIAIADKEIAEKEIIENANKDNAAIESKKNEVNCYIYKRPEKYCGETVEEKLNHIINLAKGLKSDNDIKNHIINENISNEGYDVVLLTALDDIAWVTNLRYNGEVQYNPIFISYCYIDVNNKMMHVFVDLKKFKPVKRDEETGVRNQGDDNDDILNNYYPNVLKFHPYEDFEKYLRNDNIKVESKVNKAPPKEIAIDFDQTSYGVYMLLKEVGACPVNATPIVKYLKGVKNEVELKGMRDCHARDGCALMRYMAWVTDKINNYTVEQNVAAVAYNKYKDGDDSSPILSTETDLSLLLDEFSSAEKLEKFRAEEELFIQPSFETISSSGQNGAIIHYAPKTENKNSTEKSLLRKLVREETYLVDSGGQYYDGTTDVTRVLSFGRGLKELNNNNAEIKYAEEVREAYTAVLKGVISLSSVIFPSKKVAGIQLDSFARAPLWELGLEYTHGTGHGVGSFLNVHEAPPSISTREILDKKKRTIKLQPGMIVSNEPGYYPEGKFGIRIENLMEVVKAGENEGECKTTATKYNKENFLTFKTLTKVPLNIDLIDIKALSDKEVKWINDYHKDVRKTLLPLIKAHKDELAEKYLLLWTSPI